MSEKELAAQLATALAEKDSAVALAVENSMMRDEAMSLLAAATGHIVKAKDAAPAPAPPPPPVPVAPPPPRPTSMSAFLAMPPHEQKHIAEAYGGRDKLEESLDAEFHARNRSGNSGRGESSSHRIVTFGENAPLTVAAAQDRARAEVAAYQANAPRPIPRGTPDPLALHQAALDRQIGWGGHAKAITPMPAGKAAAPKAFPSGTPVPGQKVRHLGGLSVRK